MSKYHGHFSVGTVFGRWKVINPIPEYNAKSQAKILVQCDCGTQKYVHCTHLLNGKSTSCGCSRTERTGSNNPNYRGEGAVSGMKLNSINSTYNTTFSACDLNNLASSQSYYCQWSGLPLSGNLGNATLTTAGAWFYPSATLTVHYGQQYTWAHEDIVKMKGDLPDEYFIELCYRVVERNIRPSTAITSMQEAARQTPQPAPPTSPSNPVIEAAQQIAKKYK